MDTPNNNDHVTFEKALFLVLTANEMLLPTNDEQVGDLEKTSGSTQNLPEFFSDPTFFCSHDQDNIRNLNVDESENLDAYYLKVASSQDLSESNNPAEE